MTYLEFLDRIISDGIAAALADYSGSDPLSLAKRNGAVKGFEACKGRTPEEIGRLYARASLDAARLFGRDIPESEYWESVCFQAEVEWVANCVSVLLANKNVPPLASHLPTLRAFGKVIEVVGIKGVRE